MPDRSDIAIEATTPRRDDTTHELAASAVTSEEFIEVDGAIDRPDAGPKHPSQKPITLPRVIVAGRTGVDETDVVKPLRLEQTGEISRRLGRWCLASGVCVVVATIAIWIATRSQPSAPPAPVIEPPTSPAKPPREVEVKAKPPREVEVKPTPLSVKAKPPHELEVKPRPREADVMPKPPREAGVKAKPPREIDVKPIAPEPPREVAKPTVKAKREASEEPKRQQASKRQPNPASKEPEQQPEPKWDPKALFLEPPP